MWWAEIDPLLMIRPPPRLLRLHQADSLLGAEKRAGQVRIDDGPPLLHCDVLERDAGALIPALLNSRSSRPNDLARGIEQGAHRRRIGHVGGHGTHPRRVSAEPTSAIA